MNIWLSGVAVEAAFTGSEVQFVPEAQTRRVPCREEEEPGWLVRESSRR